MPKYKRLVLQCARRVSLINRPEDGVAACRNNAHFACVITL